MLVVDESEEEESKDIKASMLYNIEGLMGWRVMGVCCVVLMNQELKKQGRLLGDNIEEEIAKAKKDSEILDMEIDGWTENWR